jgi:SNF2-related domain/Helicase conserved C-terminal domain
VKPDTTPDEVIWNTGSTIEKWIKSLPIQAATAINNYLVDKPTAWHSSTLHMPAAIVASWSATAAEQLGLPPNCPLALDIRLSGAMGKPGAKIAVRWLQPGKTITARDAVANGLWLQYQGKSYRIHSPIFDVLGLVDLFNQISDSSIEDQFRLWARIREALGDTGSSQLTDGFLRNFRVITASSLTFAIRTDARGDVQLDPVLLTERRESSGEDILKIRALNEADEAVFPQRLDQLREGVPAFPLNQGTYVVADEPLQRALTAVRKLRQAPAEQRKRAAMYPEAVIREMMGAEETEPTVFVETEKFAERVRDVGEWAVPVLPWIKISPQNWDAPQSGGLRIGGVDLPLDEPTVAQAVKDIQSAITKGEPFISVAGQRIPATAANASALGQLHSAMTKPLGKSNIDQPDDLAIKNVLIIETNFDETLFTRTTLDQRAGKPRLPHGLKTTPKKHQELGLSWLQKHWIEGSRGALLCDDMGLGKTFQALAFCLWLKECMEEGLLPQKPLLVVAPVGLLRNWEAEINEHLFFPGLGDMVRAYGDHLKLLRRGRHMDGTAGLDTARLASASVVLANYEAVSDYQLSFGAVPFLAVVLDEAQKIKSPKARMTHAIKGLNTDFVLAMTGTPIENRLADLWCIADAVQPGALSDLKSFSAKYETDGANVQGLRDQIWQEESSVDRLPKLLLRRLKSEKLDGLPQKHEHLLKIPMPARQLEAYGRALAMKEISGPEGTLGMIHALRRVSLHPSLIEGGVKASELKIEDSARFMAMINILDKVSATGEKVLIFLESLDLQDAEQLPMLLQRRYGLAKSPMVINGQVSAEARQERVNTFQRNTVFDVMLLSPKAGGVGLTLTAANHVIHLSRWWNPAVEDQCSDRVYRIGQTKPVHIYYPLAVLPDAEEYSFDWQLQMLMDRKRKLAINLLAAPAFTQEDYQSLVAGIRK